MKLSKSLLQAVAVGIAIGTISSCSLFEEEIEVTAHDDMAGELIEESTDDPDRCWSDCPACGLG